MTSINNLKQIREIYGATQEQIARALSVNRVTVANWENGSSVASGANREKMSLYYGIGPEFFYERELDDKAKKMIQQTAEKERILVEQSEGRRNKQDDFQEMFSSTTFTDAMKDYMASMKILLATTDDADLDKLRTALLINQKMGRRLEAAIKIREDEESDGTPSLGELFEKLED